jgi:hypothetical protein
VGDQISLGVKLLLKLVDALHQPTHAFQFASIFRAEKSGEKVCHSLRFTKKAIVAIAPPDLYQPID